MAILSPHRRCVSITVAALISIASPSLAPAAHSKRTLDQRIASGARILVVNAHPDDESLFGPVLAEACKMRGNPCLLASLTRGEGGTCSRGDGCPGGLAATRTRELEAAATAYGAQVTWGDFTNFPFNNSADPSDLQRLRDAWSTQRDPIAWIRGLVHQFRPDVVFTVDEDHGFYGHNEHIVVGRLVREALGAPPSPPWPDAPPLALYQVLNRYWLFAPAVGRDPHEPDETFPAHRNCGESDCMAAAIAAASNHESQLRSGIRFFRIAGPFIQTLYFRRTLIGGAQ